MDKGLKDNLITTASIMKENGVTKQDVEKYRFSFEIDNGYTTGYELLHGTDSFTIMSGKASYDKKTDTYIFDLKLQWKDRINANNLQGDSGIESVVKTLNFGMPEDYNVEINWSQKVRIS